eukprot:4602514-Prymnesium_polylepis.1
MSDAWDCILPESPSCGYGWFQDDELDDPDAGDVPGTSPESRLEHSVLQWDQTLPDAPKETD